MHQSAEKSARAFAEVYGAPGKRVVDVGGLDVNGSLREMFESLGMTYTCVDIEPHLSVDMVVPPGERLPFEDGEIDLVVSCSCFEHDPLFWLTFREMARITSEKGAIFINVPSAGPYHKHPGDNWRFYSDAAQALAFWASKPLGTEEVVAHVEVTETFHIRQINKNEPWTDLVCVWKRTSQPQDQIVVRADLGTGPVEHSLARAGVAVFKKMPEFAAPIPTQSGPPQSLQKLMHFRHTK
jgi:SAM-dependent methyltransferase